MIKCILLMTLISLSVKAWSFDPDFYFSGQIGRADIKVGNEFLEFNSPSFNEDAYSFNVALGFRPIKHLSIELGEYEIGTLEEFVGDSRVDFDCLYLALMGTINISDDWFLLGKIGSMDWETTINQVNTSQDFSKESSSTMYAFGFGWEFHWHWELIANHLFVDADGLEINATSVGVTFKF